jgi:putative aminopeptidase FrvX
MARKVDVGVLQRLSEMNGPAGFEGPVREYIADMARELGAEVEVDKMGNVHGHVRGRGPKLMLIAHMDEIGLMTADIDEQGFIFFTNLGGWDARLLPGLEVTVMAPGRDLPGTIGMKPPHITSVAERERVADMADLFVDTGLDAAALKRAGVRVGTPIAPSTSFRRLSKHRVMGKAFDDRAGCYVLLRLLEEGNLPCDVTFVWSVQEEVGARGGGPAATRVDPDYVLVIESTIAADFPGVPRQKIISRLLHGTVVTVMDRLQIADPGMLEALLEVAEERKLKVQLKKPGIGATDAGPIHLRGTGYRALPLAVPSRYIHGPASIMDLRDMENTVTLVRAMVERLAEKGA